ncbi:VOC family protein [Streptomyces sp. NPDC050263]|uniref:VOC family protein n=1 Tax=Streptomyces sp. NPDC050263 TaxID=3155037 RepID=UPI003446B086
MTTTGLQTIIYPVKDLDRAKALFSALLEVEPYADEPYYVGFKAAGQDVGLDPNGHAKGMTGPVPYWHVTDLRERLAALVAAGAELLQDAQDVGGGRLIAFLKDADGNLVGLLQDPTA